MGFFDLFSSNKVSVFGFQWNSYETIRGSRNITTIEHTPAKFDRLKIGGQCNVVIQTGTEFKVSVTTHENIHEHIVIENVFKKGMETLEIRLKNGDYRMKVFDVTVTVPSLKALRFSGGVNVKSHFDTENLTVRISGNTYFEHIGNHKTVIFDATGMADCSVTGNINTCTILASGQVDFDLTKSVIDTCNFDTSGLCGVELESCGRLLGQASGMTTIMLKTPPLVNHLRTTGSSELIIG